MAINEIHVGDIGTIFNLTINDENSTIVNLSGADVSLIFRKPDNNLLTKIPTLINSGIGGQITYVVIEGDLDLHGIWGLQAYVDYGGSGWYTDINEFKVYRNL